MVVIINVLIVRSTSKGNSRSDEFENVLLNAAAISVQNIKEIILNWRQHWDYGKGEFGNKKHQHTFRIKNWIK
jgi:threonylcarbamoyladenosine tRNA methylthiotransferase MtaB